MEKVNDNDSDLIVEEIKTQFETDIIETTNNIEKVTETKTENQLKPTTEIRPIYHDYDTLVVAGGSAKSIVSLGALQYVYDNFLHHHFRYYIGTSAGAMICYLLIIGYTPIEIIVYICTHQLLEKMQNFNIFGLVQGLGACSFNIIQEQLEKMTILKIGYLPTLKDIKKNLIKN